jgi:hypothetical protein
MAIQIKPYTPDLVSSVRAFNARLKAGGATEHFPEREDLKWPRAADSAIYKEYCLAIENNAVVRGGYVLQHQEFSFNGEILPVAFLQFPLSEGIVNKSYSLVGIRLLTNALKTQPLLFALGMGGFDQPLPRMLKTMGWPMVAVPFYFKVNHPRRFLKNIVPLRRTRLQRIVADVTANSGLGWSGVKLLHALRRKGVHHRHAVVESVGEFSQWADELWNRCRSKYPMIAVRNGPILNRLYPSDQAKFLRLKITENGRVVGWCVALDTAMSNHNYFGDMRVGSIIDCLALPDEAPKVIEAATKFLQNRGVDLIVSNQSHDAWRSALGNAGFLKGPSNFIFAASKALANKLDPFDAKKEIVHLNRGDGDGPIHL